MPAPTPANPILTPVPARSAAPFYPHDFRKTLKYEEHLARNCPLAGPHDGCLLVGPRGVLRVRGGDWTANLAKSDTFRSRAPVHRRVHRRWRIGVVVGARPGTRARGRTRAFADTGPCCALYRPALCARSPV